MNKLWWNKGINCYHHTQYVHHDTLRHEVRHGRDVSIDI